MWPFDMWPFKRMPKRTLEAETPKPVARSLTTGKPANDRYLTPASRRLAGEPGVPNPSPAPRYPGRGEAFRSRPGAPPMRSNDDPMSPYYVATTYPVTAPDPSPSSSCHGSGSSSSYDSGSSSDSGGGSCGGGD